MVAVDRILNIISVIISCVALTVKPSYCVWLILSSSVLATISQILRKRLSTIFIIFEKMLTDTCEKWTRVFSTRRWVILVARARRKKKRRKSVSTFDRFRLWTTFASSLVSVNPHAVKFSLENNLIKEFQQCLPTAWEWKKAIINSLYKLECSPRSSQNIRK